MKYSKKLQLIKKIFTKKLSKSNKFSYPLLTDGYSSSDLQEASWDFPAEIWMGIIYIIVGITFLTFLLVMFSIKRVSPNVATTYIFLQPFLSALLSYIIYDKIMDYKSIAASVLIFAGVYFVSFKKSVNR